MTSRQYLLLPRHCPALVLMLLHVLGSLFGRPAACSMTPRCCSACQDVLSLLHGAGVTNGMPDLLDFSCKSTIAVTELALSCQTEGEQRQPEKLFTIPGVPCSLVVCCTALAEPFEHMQGLCDVPACLHPS